MTGHDGMRTGAPLWLELPPHRGGQPNRLLVFLHGAGSRPETFMPVALAWQFKFPGAVAIVLEGLSPARQGSGRDWFDGSGVAHEQAGRVHHAAQEVVKRIRSAQESLQIAPSATMIVGFSQGASVGLEMALLGDSCAAVVVAHAGRLHRAIAPGTLIKPSIHLLHGELDTHVLAQHSHRAYRMFREAGARVSLDVLADGVHSIGQDMINVGTTRAMQTVFRARKRISLDQFHVALAVSLDSDEPIHRGPPPILHH